MKYKKRKSYKMNALIKNPYRASQVLDFAGILDNGMAPTDIDGLIEYKNSAYIIIEVKYRDKKMTKGQQIAIERMVQDFFKSGKRAVAILAEHSVANTQESVHVGGLRVRSIYYDAEQKWRMPKYRCNVTEFVNRYLGWIESAKVNKSIDK